jgi:hypothetical protein
MEWKDVVDYLSAAANKLPTSGMVKGEEPIDAQKILSSMPMGAASLRQILVDPKVTPEIAAAIKQFAKLHPELMDVGKNSKLVSDWTEIPGNNINEKTIGANNAKIDTSYTTLNDSEGYPRDLFTTIKNLFHEILGHSGETLDALKGGTYPEHLESLDKYRGIPNNPHELNAKDTAAKYMKELIGSKKVDF